MQLFTYITKKESLMTPIVNKLVEKGLKGGTIVDCHGMLTALESESDNVDAPPIFGSLKQIVDPEKVAHEMLIMLVKDEDIQKVKDVIHEIAGSLKEKSNGILFTVPVTNWEGVSHRE